MIVHFIASKSNMPKNIDTLREVVSTIHTGGHMLARDWIEPAFSRQMSKGPQEIDWTAVYQESMEAIAKADVIIAEATYSSFSVGYQLAIALQQKKPVLVIRSDEAEKDSFVVGVLANSAIEMTEYSEKSLRKIITKFLEDNDIQAKDMRFNFFIDRHIYNYLRWSAYKTGKTKAEILRDLVTREIDKNGKAI